MLPMKKHLYIFFLFSSSLFAQNLIPNGDFELGPDSSAEGWSLWWDSACSNPVPVNGPDFWNIVSSTPDRVLEDDIFVGCLYDIDTAQSGKTWIQVGYGEAGKTTLLTPLQKDSSYRLSYYASRETFQGTGTLQPRQEFRFNNGGNIITSPYISLAKWQYYDTVFIASANSTELEIEGIEFVTSGFKLDNISIQKESLNGINSVQNIKNAITVSPNPVVDKFTITSIIKGFNIEIYNAMGMIIRQLSNISSQEINVSELPSGIYFIKISFSNQIYNQKIIITKN